MVEFRYPDRSTAVLVARLLADLYPLGPAARVSDARLRVPWSLWERPLVPELALGYGGRLVDPDAVATEAA